MKMPRIVNFRTFLFSALASIGAVLCFVAFYKSVALAVIGMAVIVLLIILSSIVFIKDKVKTVGNVIIAVVFILTIISCITTAADYEHNTLFVGDAAQNYEINGVIEEIYDDGLSKSLLLSHKEKNKGKIMVYLQEGRGEIDLSQVNIGDEFSCVKTLDKLDFIDENGVNGYYYRLGVKYRCYVSAGEYSISDRSYVRFDYYVRERIRDGFTGALGDEYGNIAYGMVTGDKSQVQFDVRNAYSVSGIGHILAVSGLHIMFLSGMITWLCKRCGASKKVSFIITAAVLFLYNVLVGFSSSVVRATIMSLCMLIAAQCGERNDSLNNLGLSCSVYLVLRPFSLFDAGYIMSVAAVFGIIAFASPIRRALKKITHEKCDGIVKALSVSTAAQIGITPAMVIYFSKLSVFSVLANVLLSYVIMLAFVILFVSMLIALIIKPLSFISVVAYPLLYIFDASTSFISALPFSEIVLFGGGVCFTAYIAYFIMSRFVMKRRAKWPIIAVCVVYVICVFAAPNVSFDSKNARLYCYPDRYGQTVSVLYDDNGSTALIADLTGRESLFERLKHLNIKKIDEVILLNANFSVAREIIILSSKIKIGKVFAPEYDRRSVDVFDGAGIEYYIDEQDFETTPMGFYFISDGDISAAAIAFYENILFARSGFKWENADLLGKDFSMVRIYNGGNYGNKTLLTNAGVYDNANSDEYIAAGKPYFVDLRSRKVEIFH